MGYYDESTGKYIAIYNGYKVSIIETYAKDSEEEIAKFKALTKDYDVIQNNHLTRLRIKEMLIRKDIVGDKYREEFQDPEDQKLFERVEQETKNQEARKERNREVY